MSAGAIRSSRSSASTAPRGYPASFLRRVNRSSEAQPTMRPSRRTAAVAQCVSLMPRTIIAAGASSALAERFELLVGVARRRRARRELPRPPELDLRLVGASLGGEHETEIEVGPRP